MKTRYPVLTTFGKNAKALREHTGRSLRDMEAITGISNGHISMIERAEVGVSLLNAVKIADVFGVRLDDMIDGPVPIP